MRWHKPFRNRHTRPCAGARERTRSCPAAAPRHLHARRTDRYGASALVNRARLSGTRTGIRTRSLRRAWLARLPSPASLRIAAHGFLRAERLNGDPACPRHAMARWIRFQQTVKVGRLRSLPLKICPGTLDIERAASASPGHLASALGMDSVVDPVHGDCRIDPQPVAHR